MPYYSEPEGRRRRWKFWRSKSGDISHSSSAAKQNSSRSDESYRDRPTKRLDDQAFENASLPGQLVTHSSDASSELKESTASPSLNPRSLSNSSIAPVEHTKSTSTSTSSPVVTRETHTDPLTGDLIITMTTTIVTTTTTKRIIKIPPATQDEVDLDEERRLAAEYLASNGLISPKDPHHHRPGPGLHPTPRRAGSHSNLISRSAEQSPRPATSDRSYSMGSRTGPPPTFSNYARNFSRPGPKQAGEGGEAQTRLSLDARRGLKRAESMRSKVSTSTSVIFYSFHQYIDAWCLSP